VSVCHGAAGSHQGNIYLTLRASSELNEVMIQQPSDEPVEEVPCFTLDYLFEDEKLRKVDIIKIDAEGYELSVLTGSQKILENFSPVVLYENMVGNQNSNKDAAKYLSSLGYQFFAYRPFVKELVPIDSFEQMDNYLNIIAKRDCPAI
jgi:hypothetical protein